MRGIEDIRLTFATEPRTLSDPAPEPREAHFVGSYNWILEQRRYIEELLLPIGHHDMDQRRLALLRYVDQQVDRMDRMKARAWCKCVAEHLIREHLQRDNDQGPVVVKHGVERRVLSARAKLKHTSQNCLFDRR